MRVTSGRASRKSGDCGCRRRNKRRNHVAAPVTEYDDLVAFHFLVTIKADVVAAFLRRSRRSITVNDGCVEKIGLMKRSHRFCKDSFEAAVGLPLSKRAINPPAMNFWTAIPISSDRQFFPWTPEIKRLQNVIKDRMRGELGLRASTSGGEVGQDKLLELLNAQFRRNRLQLQAFRHFSSQINWNMSRVSRNP